MINVAISYPSEVEGCVLDVKKGRATISFSRDDLRFIGGIFYTILESEQPTSRNYGLSWANSPIVDAVIEEEFEAVKTSQHQA